jgi:penicillin-binding protein 2
VTLNLSIGQGENAQTVANMARFYTALATDGTAARPEIVRRAPQRERLFKLSPADMDVLRAAMAGVVSARGTAGGSRIEGVVLAGKTGTSQNPHGPDHAWFVGFAPADNPKIVVSVMVEFGGHGSDAARVASKIVANYLKVVVPTETLQTEGE